MPISHAVHISSLSSLHHSQHLLRRGQKHYHINNHNKVINDPHSNHTHTQKDANAKRVSHNIDAGSYDGGASLVEENAHVQTKTTMTMRGIHLDDEINTNFDADDDDDSLFDPSPSGNQEVDKENESAKGILTPWDENYDKETHYPNKLNSDNAWPAMPCKEWGKSIDLCRCMHVDSCPGSVHMRQNIFIATCMNMC